MSITYKAFILLISILLIPIISSAENGFFLGSNFFSIGMSEDKVLSFIGDDTKIDKLSGNRYAVLNRNLKGEWDLVGIIFMRKSKVISISRSWGNFNKEATELFSKLFNLFREVEKDQAMSVNIELFEGSSPNSKQMNIKFKFKNRHVSFGQIENESRENTVYIDDAIGED